MDSTIEQIETDSTVDFELVATETDYLVEPSDSEVEFHAQDADQIWVEWFQRRRCPNQYNCDDNFHVCDMFDRGWVGLCSRWPYAAVGRAYVLSLIHISEPTRPY